MNELNCFLTYPRSLTPVGSNTTFRSNIQETLEEAVMEFLLIHVGLCPKALQKCRACQQLFIPNLYFCNFGTFFSLGRKMNTVRKIRAADCSLLKTNVEHADGILVSFSNLQSTKCKLSIRSFVQDWLQMGSKKKAAPRLVVKSPQHNLGHDVISTF